MLSNVALTRVVPAEHPDVQVLWFPSSREPKPRPRLKGPLLVDASNSTAMEAPLRLAQVLARRDRVKVHVLAVVDPLPSLRSLAASVTTGLDAQELNECRQKLARSRARARVSEHVGLSSFFGTSAALGSRLATLASTARSDSASYLLGSLAPIGTAEREESATTASRLAAEAATPVLAVPASVDLLPRSALAAIDLGEASMEAARATLPVLGDAASLTLVHVAPEASSETSGGALEALRGLAKELAAAADVAVHLVLLQGDPVKVLAEWVPEFDLVALGASRGEALGSGLATSVSAVAFEHARGALLVAPAMHEEEKSPSLESSGRRLGRVADGRGGQGR